MVQLSKHPNVFIKLGGLGMEIYGLGWHKRSVPPNSSELAEIMAPYYWVRSIDIFKLCVKKNPNLDNNNLKANYRRISQVKP